MELVPFVYIGPVPGIPVLAFVSMLSVPDPKTFKCVGDYKPWHQCFNRGGEITLRKETRYNLTNFSLLPSRLYGSHRGCPSGNGTGVTTRRKIRECDINHGDVGKNHNGYG